MPGFRIDITLFVMKEDMIKLFDRTNHYKSLVVAFSLAETYPALNEERMVYFRRYWQAVSINAGNFGSSNFYTEPANWSDVETNAMWYRLMAFDVIDADLHLKPIKSKSFRRYARYVAKNMVSGNIVISDDNTTIWHKILIPGDTL